LAGCWLALDCAWSAGVARIDAIAKTSSAAANVLRKLEFLFTGAIGSPAKKS
jgi:hypothetical protein